MWEPALQLLTGAVMVSGTGFVTVVGVIALADCEKLQTDCL